MQTVIEDAQVKCQNANRLRYTLKNKGDRVKLRVTVSNVYYAIKIEDIPMLVDRVKQLDRVYNELNIRR